ncbi:hypothetical protein CDR68_06705 [Salmonella enterica]|nr:hypothetical protein [Salmonella enterica]
MILKPFNVKINKHFCEINNSDLKLGFLKEINNKVLLMQQYYNYNYNLTFYHNALYYFPANDRRYIVFGHDLEGYFVIDEQNKKIYHLSDGKDGETFYSLVFCNTSINHFINFNNIFIFMTLEQGKILNNENKGDIDDEKIFDILDDYFTECDPLSMTEDMFWYGRTYMLRDGFFPTNDSQINFYKEMMLKLKISNE